MWGHRGLIIGLTLVGLVIGIAYAMTNGGKYAITMTLMPAETDAEKSNSLQLSSLLSTGGDTPLSAFKQFQNELFSYQTAFFLEKKYDTLCEIYPQRCNLKTHQWQPKSPLRKALSVAVSTVIGKPPSPDMPQVDDLVKYLQTAISLTTDRFTSVTTLTMTARDPQKGAQILNRLVDAANQSVRNRDRSNLRQYVDYLSKKLQDLSTVDQRSALDNLLLAEERRLMLTEVDVPYAAARLDGPNAVPTTAVAQIGIGLLGGFVLGSLIALFLQFGGLSMLSGRTKSDAISRGADD